MINDDETRFKFCNVFTLEAVDIIFEENKVGTWIKLDSEDDNNRIIQFLQNEFQQSVYNDSNAYKYIKGEVEYLYIDFDSDEHQGDEINTYMYETNKDYDTLYKNNEYTYNHLSSKDILLPYISTVDILLSNLDELEKRL